MIEGEGAREAEGGRELEGASERGREQPVDKRSRFKAK